MVVRSAFGPRAAVVAMVAAIVTLAGACVVPPPPFEAIAYDYTGGVKAAHVGVPYGPLHTQRLDLYDSPGNKGTIVYLHGGSWVVGNRAVIPSLLAYQVTRGWDLVSIDYRLAGEATFPSAVYDASAAVAWVRDKGPSYGVDSRRVVLSGWSAGANIAALAAYGANNPAFLGGDLVAVDGLLSLAGAYDMTTIDIPGIEKAGGWLHKALDGRRASSPINLLDANDPPTLAIHGVEDPILPVAQVRALRARSNAVGYGKRLSVIETSSPPFEPRCRAHEPWCAAPVAQVNAFLDGLVPAR